MKGAPAACVVRGKSKERVFGSVNGEVRCAHMLWRARRAAPGERVSALLRAVVRRLLRKQAARPFADTLIMPDTFHLPKNWN